MNVSFLITLGCLACLISGLALDLRRVSELDRVIDQVRKRRASPGPKSTQSEGELLELESSSGAITPAFAAWSEPNFTEPYDEPPEVVIEPAPEIDFEHEQIRSLVDFIEFRLSEINALISECIDFQFGFDPSITAQKVRDICAGSRFQVLYANYHEGIKRLKTTLLEMMRIKLQQLDDLYYDEVLYFLDLVEQLVDSDFDLGKSLEAAKRSSKYYSSPRMFEVVVEIAMDEINAFDEIRDRFLRRRREIQKRLEDRMVKAEETQQVIDNYVEMKTRQQEDWEWDESDIPPMEEDESDESEEEDSPTAMEEPNEEEPPEEEPHEEEHEEELEEEPSYPQLTQEEEEDDGYSDESDDEPRKRKRRRQRPVTAAPSPPAVDNSVENLTGALGSSVGQAAEALNQVGQLGVKTVDNILSSPVMSSFTNILSNQLTSSLKVPKIRQRRMQLKPN